MGACSVKPSAEESHKYSHISNVGTRSSALNRKIKQAAIKMEGPAPGKALPLLNAAMRGDTNHVQRLLSNGADVNQRDDINKMTALHFAAKGDNVAAAFILLEAGADVNAKNTYHATPLLIAAGYGAMATVRLLLSAHAQVNCVDLKGMAPLHWAAQQRKKEIVLMLLEAGAELNKKCCSGETPYGIAEDWGTISMATLLKQRGGLRVP